MEAPTHNSQLMALIQNIDSQVRAAKSNADLVKAISLVQSFKGSLRFDYAIPITAAAVGAVVLAFSLWLALWAPQSVRYWLTDTLPVEPMVVFIVTLLGSACVVLSSLTFLGSRAALIPNLSKRIASRSALFTAGLAPVRASSDKVIQQLRSAFNDYERGNYSREIKRSLAAIYAGERHQIPYSWHHLHFVNERIVTETVSNGRGGTRTVKRKVYDHYDRFSLVFDFPWVSGISLRSDSQGCIDHPDYWATSSSDFNQQFKLSGPTKIECAKFAKPSTILLLLELHKLFTAMNMEFSSGGQLCLSFDNDDLLAFDSVGDLYDAAEFAVAIHRGVPIPALASLLPKIHALAEQHDDNFQKSPSKTWSSN